jgi:hypothetical protein
MSKDGGSMNGSADDHRRRLPQRHSRHKIERL